MEPWILIWTLMTHHGVATHSQEFTGKVACEYVKRRVEDAHRGKLDALIIIECYPK